MLLLLQVFLTDLVKALIMNFGAFYRMSQTLFGHAIQKGRNNLLDWNKHWPRLMALYEWLLLPMRMLNYDPFHTSFLPLNFSFNNTLRTHKTFLLLNSSSFIRSSFNQQNRKHDKAIWKGRKLWELRITSLELKLDKENKKIKVVFAPKRSSLIVSN